MVNPELMAFAAYLRQREDLRLAVHTVCAPEEIVSLGEEAGFRFSVRNLREALPLLGAAHWVWTGREPAWVLAFFEGAFAGQQPPIRLADGAVERVEWLHDHPSDWRSRRTG